MAAIWILLAMTAGAEPAPPITALAVTPDGKSYVQGSQAGVVVRTLAGKEERRIVTTLDHVHAIAFSADGRRLAIAGGSPAEKGTVELFSWPEARLQARLEGHDDVVYDLAWLGDRLATAGGDRAVRIWNAASGKCETTLQGHSGPVLALAVSPDGKLLCSGSVDQTIRVWDPASGKLLRSLNNHLGTVHGLAFRPVQPEGASPCLASVSEDGTLRIWQPAIGRLVRIVRQPAPVLCVAWSGDGGLVYAGCKDGFVRGIDADSDQVLSEIRLEQGWPVSLSLPLVGSSAGRVVRP